jgi:fumarate hydratase subunit beta
MADIIKINMPVKEEIVKSLMIGDQIEISGKIFCGRDAVLPQIVTLLTEKGENALGVSLQGGAIFHTAVSPAGIGPTTSSKAEIQGTMGPLSKLGIKFHIGKGALPEETVDILAKFNSIFVITPPVTALFNNSMISERVVAFENEGMEAFFELEVKDFPAIVAIAHGKSIF